MYYTLMSYSGVLILTHLCWFQISIKCNHKKLACDPHDACDRCLETANYQHCDGVQLVCTKCVNLSKADWTTIHKSRRRKLRRRKSADTLVKQDQEDNNRVPKMWPLEPMANGVATGVPSVPWPMGCHKGQLFIFSFRRPRK